MPSTPPGTAYVGRSIPRREGRDKVTGAAGYIDDLRFEGLVHGVTVRSPAPRGLIRAIRFEGDLPWGEIAIVTAKDIPGENHVALILHDQPFLADGVVNHPEEPVVLLAHPDRHLLEVARRHVKIEIDPRPPVFTIEDALAKKEVVWGEDNVFKRYEVLKGDVDAAFARQDVIVVEGEYRTGAQEQLYIENQGMVALAGREGGGEVHVWGSLQCPYYVHKALVPLFKLPEDRVRVTQVETGGGFGGKEEYPSLVAGHAALLSWKLGRPVKIVYDRAEDMVATTKRHPSRTRHRTAVTREGEIVAMDIDFVIDGGAYCTLSPVVLSRGTIHAAGPYRTPNVRIRSAAVATNAPPHGAFRGFGAPQSIFACERHLDEVAASIGMDPAELRRRNFLREGDTTATGQVIRENLDLPGLLDRALAASGWAEKRARYGLQAVRREAPGQGGPPLLRNGEGPRGIHSRGEGGAAPMGAEIKRGIGLACFMHGAGFTGSGERMLASKAAVEIAAGGEVRVLAASTEIGQGTKTVFAQIAADALSVPVEQVTVVQPDTGLVPDSGPTVASRTVMVVGGLVEKAARALRARLAAGERPPLRALAEYEAPEGIFWDDAKYQGDAYATYAWAVYVAEASVDTVTYEARCEGFVAVQEVGRVVNPALAAGQIEGGVAQGIGMALTEQVVWQEGRMANGQLTNYIIPTAADVPPIRVIFEDALYAGAAAGPKGIGELPHDGPAPAIANAVSAALGRPLGEVPLLPERIMEIVDLERAQRAG